MALSQFAARLAGRSVLVVGALAIGFAALQAADAPKPGDVVTNSIGMKLAYIPAGEFDIGSAADEKGHEEDETLHRVKITHAFRIGVTEVTQAQWKAVMGQRRGKFEGDDLPVEEISWADAKAFCEKLSKAEGKTYRLPTESEWEYACRAGAIGRFAGEKLADLGWFDDNADEKTHPVTAKKPNAWGLYDMHGNVAEWCADAYAPGYPPGPVADPAGPAEGKGRVVRGGSFASLERGCRCASRSSAPAAYQMKTVGLRVVCAIDHN
jgi:formylglycine-generating enzyme required for sulfatase activity